MSDCYWEFVPTCVSTWPEPADFVYFSIFHVGANFESVGLRGKINPFECVLVGLKFNLNVCGPSGILRVGRGLYG